MATWQLVRRLYLQFVIVIGIGEVSFAQGVVNMPDVTKRPTAQSSSLDTDPVIDGEVIMMKYGKS